MKTEQELLQRIKNINSEKDLETLTIGDIVKVKNLGGMVYEGIIDNRMAFMKSSCFLNKIRSYRIRKERIEILPNGIYFYDTGSILYSLDNCNEYNKKRQILYEAGL